ncbi:hypothetical protein DOY81_011298 [Sarcophaga bullata]|nr:hypothetical protein DOY81_011298 [Sarcophaga bullata]
MVLEVIAARGGGEDKFLSATLFASVEESSVFIRFLKEDRVKSSSEFFNHIFIR